MPNDDQNNTTTNPQAPQVQPAGIPPVIPDIAPPPPPEPVGMPVPPINQEPKPEEKKEGKEKEKKEIKPGGKKKGRMIATILGLFLLVGGVAAGAVLVQNQQDVREHAAGYVGDCNSTYQASCVDSDWTCGTTYYDATCTNSNQKCGLNCSPPACLSNNTCKGPSDTCCNGEHFDSSCGLTETRCGPSTSGGGGCTAIGTCRPINGTCCSGNTTPDTNCLSGVKCAAPPSCRTEGQSCTSDGQCCGTGLSCQSGQCTSNCVAANECLGPGTVCCEFLTMKQTNPGDTPYCELTETLCVSGSGGGGGGNQTPQATNNPNNPSSCQCTEVIVLDSNDEKLSSADLANLKAGDLIKFAVRGTYAGPGQIDKARFVINGETSRTLSTLRPRAGNQYYVLQYTVPEGVTEFTVKAELHHTILNWF